MPTDNQGQVTITELDECELLPALCKGGTCQNTYGSFKCTCPSGYVIDDTFICVGKLRASVCSYDVGKLEKVFIHIVKEYIHLNYD